MTSYTRLKVESLWSKAFLFFETDVAKIYGTSFEQYSKVVKKCMNISMMKQEPTQHSNLGKIIQSHL